MNLDARLLLQVDFDHPWLGLESFSESTRSYFFGRDAEAAELLRRLRLHPLLVFYGRSGLGKTSLLRAKLIPELEKLGARPAFYRISYREGENSPLEQLAVTLEAGGNINGPGFALPEDAASRLWLQLHRREHKDRITHLILDQFEEIFTIGAERPGAEAEVRQAIAILVQGAIPMPIETQLDEGETFLKHFHLDVPPLPVLLSLREDYVFALNRWRSHLTQLGQNNFELHALRGPASFGAVFKPGELRCHYRGEVKEENKVVIGLPPIISRDTTQRIVRFIAKRGEEVPIEEIEAVPPILSLLCRELNERRFTEPAGTPAAPAAEITFRESDADIETIISTFYERCLAGRPEAVRMFFEEEFVSPYSGARLQQDEQGILKVFADGYKIPGAADHRRVAGYGNVSDARNCLKDLVNQRLLTAVSGGENPAYELIHDLLAGVVEKSRTARQERLEKEEAARLAEAEKRAKEKAEKEARLTRSRARIVVITVSAALAVAVLAAIIGFVQYGRAVAAKREAQEATKRVTAALKEVEKAKSAAEEATKHATDALEQLKKAKSAADELIRFMQYDLRDTLGKLGHLEMMGAINARIMKYYDDHPPEAGDVNALRERAVEFIQQGDILSARGDHPGALKSYRHSLAIMDKLTKQDPSNADWQRVLSISYERIGNVLSAQGDQAGALKSYRDELAIFEKLTKQDPSNADWQYGLNVSYEKVGDVLRTQGDQAGALKSYRDSLAILEKLTKQDPSNANWQYGLSVGYEKVGDVLSAQDDQASALKNYRDDLAIREKLAKQDPTNAEWQADLAFSYWRTGSTLARSDPHSKKEGQSKIEKGRDILRQLKERAGLGTQQQGWLDSIEADLQKMQEQK